MKDLAASAGVDISIVSRWEKGRAAPSLESLGRIGDKLGLHFGDLDDLVTDATGQPRRPRRREPVRTRAEIDALVLWLMGPLPQSGPEPEPQTSHRDLLRTLLVHIAVSNGMPRE